MVSCRTPHRYTQLSTRPVWCPWRSTVSGTLTATALAVSPTVVVLIVLFAFGTALAIFVFTRKRSTPADTRHDEPPKSLQPQAVLSVIPHEQLEQEAEEIAPTDYELRIFGVGRTDVGLRRKLNEDAFVCLPEHELYALADGMGAHAAGEVASKLTLEAISDAFEHNRYLSAEGSEQPSHRKMRLVRILERANQIVWTMSNEVQAYRGMGTTVVMAHFSVHKRYVFIANVGDSRCYRIRDGQLTQLTTDHTLGSVGVLGKTSSLLSRAVGIEPNVEVDIMTYRTKPDDILLLCSDGLSRMVADDQICATVMDHPDLNVAADALIAKAKDAGGKDNITAVLIRMEKLPPSNHEGDSGLRDRTTLPV